jgi:WD40 repeat protein
MDLPDLSRVDGHDGEIRPVFTCKVESAETFCLLPSYTPSEGGAPRLVAALMSRCVAVWDSATGGLLHALEGPSVDYNFTALVTYQRPSDRCPRIAAGFERGDICIWDGDDFTVLQKMQEGAALPRIRALAVYEEPTTGAVRLVAA